MTLADRRNRERAAQRALIIGSARALAETEGWDAVTTRRLSAAIEYSQPVIYKHFPSMEAIVDAVALEGFADLADALRRERAAAASPEEAVRLAARAYHDFATHSPALYDAMLTRPSRVPFARGGTPAPLADAFAQLREALTAVTGEEDADAATEVFWATLHGLTALERSGRLRPDQVDTRLTLLVSRFASPER